MNDPPIGSTSVLCRNCGSPGMMHGPNPAPGSDVICADCGSRFGTYAEFVALAEAEALSAIREALGEPGQ